MNDESSGKEPAVPSQEPVKESLSHCWEPDGSFHSVCIFVICISSACALVSLLCIYRIVKIVVQSWREPQRVNETLKMYRLNPNSGSRDLDTTVAETRLVGGGGHRNGGGGGRRGATPAAPPSATTSEDERANVDRIETVDVVMMDRGQEDSVKPECLC